MSFVVRSSLCAASVLAAFTALAQPAIEETRTAIEQWVETRRIISEEQADWRAEKESLEATRQLLQSELETLQERTSELESTNTEADQEKYKLNLQRTEYRRVETLINERLSAMEQRLLSLANRFPEPLMAKIEPLLTRIPTNPEEAEGANLGARLGNVVGILSLAEKFNRTITFQPETREVGSGKKEQVDVIYWGLAGAYYVDNDREFAGFGKPGPEGWIWTERNEAAANIGQLADVYEGTADAEFVIAPIELQ